MAFRDDLHALEQRHEVLSAEAAAAARERDHVRAMLDEAKTRARLPILENLRVASPCRADWAKMSGDDRMRHCGDCKKDVFNLSDMTREEAEALLVERTGSLCVRYFQRHDGTVLLADCEVGQKRARRRKLVVIAGAAAMLAGGAAVALELVHRHAGPHPTMGEVSSTYVEVKLGQAPAPQPQYKSQLGTAVHKANGNFVIGNK